MAVKYTGLISITWNWIQNHRSSPLTQVRIFSWDSSECVESKLSAYNISISTIPPIVTDCSPVSINTHFNSSSPSCLTRAKTDTALCTIIWTYIYQVSRLNTLQANSLSNLRKHCTPASSWCLQVCTPIPLWEQLMRASSFPLHPTLLRNIPPLPCPKKAFVKEIPPALCRHHCRCHNITVALQNRAHERSTLH